MKYLNAFRAAPVIVGFLAFLAWAPGQAAAATVPCDTFDPCTAGVCLEDGTCEATPANNGAECETANPCTKGTCSNGECAESPSNNGQDCEPFDACREKDGKCSQGECVADPIPNGNACRADVLGPCLVGTCTTISTFSFCVPESKCGGGFENPCEFDCNILTGACETFPTHICDTACTTATCVPGDDFEHTCTNRVNRANNTPCEDGKVCTENDKCASGECVGEPTGGGGGDCGDGNIDSPEECDDGDAVFKQGEYCDAECTLVPCGKPTNSSGGPKSSDALFILKTAVNLVDCDLSVCDVNHSNSITTADALLTLRAAVALPVNLNCPSAA
jgi:hypothetical protein